MKINISLITRICPVGLLRSSCCRLRAGRRSNDAALTSSQPSIQCKRVSIKHYVGKSEVPIARIDNRKLLRQSRGPVLDDRNRHRQAGGVVRWRMRNQKTLSVRRDGERVIRPRPGAGPGMRKVDVRRVEEIFSSLCGAKYPMNRLSGDQNGFAASSVPEAVAPSANRLGVSTTGSCRTRPAR